MMFFLAAVCLFLLSAAAAPFSRRGSLLWDRLSFLCGIGGALLGIAATLFCLARPETAVLDLLWPGIGGRFVLRIDALAAVFLLPAFFITAAGLLFGAGYWPAVEQPGSSAWIRFFYPLLAAGIAVLLTAGNGVLFLIGWEIMALAGYFLVVTDRHSDEAQQAGFLYLAATHTGTLALFGMFALLGGQVCLDGLPAAGSLAVGTVNATAIFLLALFGFGFKAGIIPLHIWLPRAHAAAPSHVSALMSGVMIKAGIYGIVRITSFFTEVPPWWGWLILIVGMSSGLLGVLFAICQHDIKRLLAYHSVENIGIILIGIGIALLGRSHGIASAMVLGMAGALLHVINHGLFKGLLFLGAGSLIHATGTRQLAAYGGLLKLMPATAIFFLGGSVAICGLPPLNGFVSEWLVYLGLFQGGMDPSGLLTGSLFALVALAMIGGLALLCFAKVFGLAFLGMPRRDLRTVREAPGSMQAGMALLFAACLWIGVVPGSVLSLLDAGVAAGLAVPPGNGMVLAALAPAGYVGWAALVLVVLAGFFWWRERGRGRGGEKIPRQPTWGCGYALSLPRAQYSASSFAEMIVGMFNWTMGTRTQGGKVGLLFPETVSFSVQAPDPVLDRAILPAYGKSCELAARMRRAVHHGMIGVYLLYSALTLCVLLAAVIFW